MVSDAANLSREFRSLVTAIRGPLEEELAERGALPAMRRERIKSLQRSFMRLLQLVNTLFDQSGIEAPRRSSPELVQMAAAKTVVIPMLRADGSEHTEQPGKTLTAAEQVRAVQDLEAFRHAASHELRDPLQAIAALSEALIGDHAHALDSDGRELVDQIHGNARRMSGLVDDLLALSQAAGGELVRDVVDVTAIARRVMADLRLREPSRVVEAGVADDLIAHGDAQLIAIALENLFDNAWKFTAARRPAQIVLERDERGVYAVRDNGAGFEARGASRMFEPFQRLHGAEFPGAGLGLAIARRAIERHGGRIWAHGALDGGATLRFTLEPEAGL